MKNKYEPYYAKGQILVNFGSDVNLEFVKEFGKRIGYKFLGIEAVADYYVFETGIGKEAEAMKEFLSYDKFVNSVERRDLRLEKRFDFSESLESKVRELDLSLSRKELFEKLENIKNYISKFNDEIGD